MTIKSRIPLQMGVHFQKTLSLAWIGLFQKFQSLKSIFICSYIVKIICSIQKGIQTKLLLTNDNFIAFSHFKHIALRREVSCNFT